LGLFQKRIDGDDALLRLAALRFKEAGLGAEFYAESPEELTRLMGFGPTPESPAVVHLNRNMNILEESSLDSILDFAGIFKNRVFGLVIHDQMELVTRNDRYLAALKNIGSRLEKLPKSPLLFVEYAAGCDLDLFLETLRALQDFWWLSGCVDIGHIGLWQVRTACSKKHPGKNVCGLTPQDPELPELVEDLQTAVGSALSVVLDVIRTLGRMGKPLHLHLHDGHPLSTASPLGVSDHLSFLEEIPIPFEYRKKHSLAPMFGPSGLARIVAESLRLPGPDKVSFCLEIHPTEEKLPLGEASHLFDHWTDKSNAERMNHWLSVLQRNHQLVKGACLKAAGGQLVAVSC
jgi:hypothetical protein